MMQLSDISIWGVVALAVVLGATVTYVGMISRSDMQRLVRGLLFLTGSMVLLGGILWAVCWLDSWWACWSWLAVMGLVVAVLVHGKTRLPLLTLWTTFLPAVLVGMVVAVGLMLLCLPAKGKPELFVALVAVASSGLHASLPVALQAYLGSLRHTKIHMLYLKANGATQQEALMPSVHRCVRASMLPSLRSWVRPLLVAPPLLFGGLLLAGLTPVVAAVVCFLSLLASFVATIAAVAVLLVLSNRTLFNAQGQFLY